MVDTSMILKLKGYNLEATFTKKIHLLFTKSNTMYTWKNVSYNINGVLRAKIWFSKEGETIIVNHRTNETCLTKYYPPPVSLFSKEPINKVECLIRDTNERVHFLVEGCSSTHLDYARVLVPQKLDSNEKIFHDLKNRLKLGEKTFLWKNIDIR